MRGTLVRSPCPRPLWIGLFISLFATLAAAPPTQAQTPPTAAPVRLTLTDATARALEANLTHKARLLDREVAASEIDIARERLNPDFGYEGQRDGPYHVFMLTVPIELGGKRANRVRVGEASR